MTANENVNRLVVMGLMVIDLVLWVGILILHYTKGTVDNAMVLAAGSIPAGLIGYINRDSKHTPDSTVDAGNAQTVNVTNTPTPVAGSAGETP